jgi:type I restriction enzyme S subunit
MKHINVGDMLRFMIPVPPTREEQQAIAKVLSDTDKLIQALEKKIEKKRLIKKGVMQKLLTPKEDWEPTTLGQLATIVGGGTPSTSNPEFWNGTISWFTPTEVGKQKYLGLSNRRITSKGLKASSAQVLPKNSILLTSRAGIGDVGILTHESATNQGFQSLIVNDENDYEFIYYLLCTLKPKLLSSASGSTFLEISPNKVKSIEVCVPSLNEQSSLASVLTAMDSDIEQHELQCTKYKSLKQALMQQLLTGKIRLV